MRSDGLDAAGWAVGFIWAGLVLLAETTGYATSQEWPDVWAIFFVGAGVSVLLQAGIRLLVPRFRHKLISTTVFGLILLTLGLGDQAAWLWAVALMIVGVGILAGISGRAGRHRRTRR